MTMDAVESLPLVDRIRAEIDEREALARATQEPDAAGWWEPADLASGGYIPREDAAYIAANGPDVALRTIQAHREMVTRLETALVARDAAVDTLLAGATRLVVRLNEENVRLLLPIYFPESESP
jgi:hypothetical protein